MIGVILLAIGIPLFLSLYKPPTCFDGLQNGEEQGLDCGGSCVRLCPSAFMSPSVSWTRSEEVAPGLYNLSAYIINPNTEGGASNVPFRMVAYDKDGVSIKEVRGRLTLPPHRNTLAFAGLVDLGKRKSYKIFFEFTGIPDWKKISDPLSALRMADKKFVDDVNGSSLLVTLENSSVYDLSRMSVYAVLYDADSNVLGFSKTVIDGVPSKSTVMAPFTWPVGRNGKVVSIEVLPVAE